MDESNSKATDQVNANKVALLVIDVQQGLFDNPIPIYVLKRRCYGLFNRQHWFQRIFLDLEGYRWFGLACPPYLAPTTPIPKEPV